MTGYLVRRVFLIIPTLLIVCTIIFIAVRLIPGSIIDAMLSQMGGTITWQSEVNTREMLKERLGLDVPIYVQFGRWINGILHGDLGKSLWNDTPVAQSVLPRLPVSFELGIIGLLSSVLISFSVGILSAIRQDTLGDYIGRTIAIVFMAVPGFWLGTMVVVFPSIWFDWSPAITYIPFIQDPLGNLVQFAIPGLILGMGMCGANMRYIRTCMLEVLRADYIRTAWSKGLGERVVITRHVLKNALIPIVTSVGYSLPVLVSGSVIIEQIFALPGMGRLFVDAAFSRDYPIISGVALLVAAVIVVNNLFIDIVYANLDPRVKYR